MPENKHDMQQSIGGMAALATVAGTVIGAGVFFKAGAVTAATHSPLLALIVWLLAGIITVCAGLTCAELAAAFPETGGLMKYIEHAYGRFWGFLAGWAQSFIYFPANIAAIAIVFSTQFINLMGWSSRWIIPGAIVTAVVVLAVNLISVRAGGIVQTVTLIVKLIPLALIVAVGLMHGQSLSLARLGAPAHSGHYSLAAALANGLLATMFAYDGWINVGNIAGEMKRPGRDLPRAIGWGLTLVTGVYVVVNLVFLLVLPFSLVTGNLNVAALAADRLFGPLGGRIVTVGILISVYGALNGYVMTGMRVPYVLGQERRLPGSNWFARLNRGGVPWFAGMVQLAIAALLALSGSFNAVTNMLVFVIWIFYLLAFCGVIKLRCTQPTLARPYRVPGYPVIPLFAIAGGCFILGMTLFTQAQITVLGILATLIGVPVYWWSQWLEQ